MQAPFVDPLPELAALNKVPWVSQTQTSLVGRELEMQVIAALLDTVAYHRPSGARALTISGDMGIGKSRLLAEVYAEAHTRGFRVLEGRIFEPGSMFPYFPFIEALRPVIRSSSLKQLHHYVGLDTESLVRSDVIEAISLTGTPLVAALTRFFPELPKVLHVTIVPEVLSPDQEKFRLFDAVATLLERMAIEQPVLLGIDNLQWADSTSLELMMYLVVRLHSSSVALVGTVRSPAPSNWSATDESMLPTIATNAAAKAVSELMRQGLLLLLPLSPLASDAAAQHLHALLPGTLSESLIQSLLMRAEGNPFFLEELVRMLAINGQLVLRDGIWRASGPIGKELPGSITLAVAQRLSGLSSSCRELLEIASLFGRTFPLYPLLKVFREDSGRHEKESEESIEQIIDEAIRAGVIAKHDLDGPFPTCSGEACPRHCEDALYAVSTSPLAPPTYIFCQSIVQEVLSTEVPPQRARSLHALIGAALEAEYADEAAGRAAELARHYALSGEKEAAIHWGFLAGQQAVRQHAHREAIGHFRLALKLLEARAQANQSGGVISNTQSQYAASFFNARSTKGQIAPSLAQLHLAIGESWFKLGELEQASHALQQALVQLHSDNSGPSLDTPTPSSNSSSVPQAASSLLLAQTNRLIADIYRMQGKYELALSHLQAARKALDQNLQKSAEHILLLQAQATLDLLLYRPREAEMALWQSHQLATETGDRGSQAFALHLIGWIRGWGEHIHEAIRLQKQAHELYVAVGDPFRATLGDQGLGIIYQALGEMDSARLHNLRGFEQAERYGVRYVLGWFQWNFGVLALAQGDWNSSAIHLQQALQEAEATSNVRLKAVVIQAQAELHFRKGDWHEAEQSFQAAISAAINTEWYPGTVALYGHFLAVTGRNLAARIQLDRAAELPEPVGYSGHFYIPFLAEGYLHLGASERAATYIERIGLLRGFMYYGTSVDRILGEIAARSGNWEKAEQAFEDGLALCRRSKNQPEEAAILYEQARTLLMQSGMKADQEITINRGATSLQSLQRLHRLCDRARELFLQYDMQRAARLVDTLQQGVRQLEQADSAGSTRQAARDQVAIKARGFGEPSPPSSSSEHQLDLQLTRRELEVLHLVAEGYTDREVAESLVISHRTVNRHLSNIFVKLDVPGRAAAVAYAIRQGFVG